MHKELTLSEIQREELSILKKTIKFLDNNKINYFIFAGSLIGAVRHKGFIPWDDDIDIAIPRADYEKLIQILLKRDLTIDKNIKVDGYEVGKSYWPFLKIINENICVETKNRWEQFLWIDIFPLDGLPKYSKFYLKKMVFFKKLFIEKKNIELKNENIHKKNAYKIVWNIIDLFLKRISFSKFTTYYINYAKKYDVNTSNNVCNNVWGVGDKEKFPKSILNDITLYDFENIKVKGFKNYDIWLKNRYGNYMEMPPVENRITHDFKAWRIK